MTSNFKTTNTMETILNELTTAELVEMVDNFFDYEVYRDFAYTCPENANLTMDEALRKWAIGTICEEVSEDEIREYACGCRYVQQRRESLQENLIITTLNNDKNEDNEHEN